MLPSAFVFGDIVRIVADTATEERGIAGGVGMVVGANVKAAAEAILGRRHNRGADYAVNAWFEARREQFWFHPELLEPAQPG